MGVLQAILAVFTGVGEWFTSAIPALVPMFWTAAESGDGGTLTFLGVLAVAGLSFSVIFLLVGIIQKFMRFGA